LIASTDGADAADSVPVATNPFPTGVAPATF
jgi:hypothetical protein